MFAFDSDEYSEFVLDVISFTTNFSANVYSAMQLFDDENPSLDINFANAAPYGFVTAGHGLIGPIAPYETSPPVQYEPAGHCVGIMSPGVLM